MKQWKVIKPTGLGAIMLLAFTLSLPGCGGGGGGSSTSTYTVTATVGGGNGTISPDSAMVDEGSTASFTVTPDSGYAISSVTGCDGSLVDNTYTTGAITADCTVTASFSPPVVFSNGQNASVVIGEADFNTSTGGTTQSLIKGAWGNADVINGVLYLSDYTNSRVLGFNTIPTSNGASADFVLGADDFISAGTLTSPQTVADYNGALYVVRCNGVNLIDVYNTIPTADTTAPIAATPQTADFQLTAALAGGLSNPETMSVAGGKLVVADALNNRVLIWNSVPTSDTAPDLVLGQADFTGTDYNAGVSPTASTLAYPDGIWTDGTRLVVTDSSNNRVLIWNTFPDSNDQPADLVLGQTDFNSVDINQGLGKSNPTASTLYDTYGVDVHGNQLFVADYGNRRVLIWNSWPTANGQAADVVLGQADFVTVTNGPTQSLMVGPTGLHLSGTQLIVSEGYANRYLVFDGHY